MNESLKILNRNITVDLERKYSLFDDTGESDDESYVDSDQSSSTASSFASFKYVCGWFLLGSNFSIIRKITLVLLIYLLSF